MAISYTESTTVNGLGTFNFGVPEAGVYNVIGNITLPTISAGDSANSQVVVTIKVNSGSTVYTGTAGAKGFQFKTQMSANDIFNITLTSSTSVDQGLNKIKTTITISEA